MEQRKLLRAILTVMGFAALILDPVARAAQMPVVPKWARFELVLKSHRDYTNALQEAEMRVLFVSPLGETNRTYGFWDGGRIWRARFAPNFPGRWTYYTMCSDTANAGLHEQTGEFLCSAATGGSRFGEHGPIQVARDHEHFEYADRTPFLWLGDAAWDAATQATRAEWEYYLNSRVTQRFNTVQWRLATAETGQTSGAFSGRECIKLNLDFFKQLDAKVDALTHAGLLNGIAPLWEIDAGTAQTLPEAQAIVLLRYVVARWGGNPVAWILAFESDSTGAQAARWQRIGRAVFNPVTHGPVIVFPGEATWVLSEFRSEPWVDALGFQTMQVTDAEALPWLLQGPLSLERNKLPARPLITLAPAAEAALSTEQGKLVTAGFARRVMWWSLLINTPAGVSYAAKDVAEWTPSKANDAEPSWRGALALPGAGAIAPLADFFRPLDFWRLKPLPQTVLVQSEPGALRNYIAASTTATGDLVLLYVPEQRVVKVLPGTWPATVETKWFEPRTGETRPAADVRVSPSGWEYTTPSAEDWVLLVYSKK